MVHGKVRLTLYSKNSPTDMTKRQRTKTGFGDEDLTELAALLESRAVPFRGMSLEMLDGFLCALAVGPDLVPPSEWLPPVWGGRPPHWESIEEAEHVNGLLMRMWNDVVRRVAIEPELAMDRDMPVIAIPDEAHLAEEPYAADWAAGFIVGVKMRVNEWGAWCAKDNWIDSTLVGIETLSSGQWMAIEVGAKPEPLAAKDRLELIGSLPYTLHDFHVYRVQQMVSRTPIRREAAPGRNDPCPCGSGRKFKKCCGAPATVH